MKNLETAEPLKLSPVPHHADTLVSCSDVTIWYDGEQVCNPVSFVVRQGERVLLEGKNGSGKSSLLKLLLGHSIEHTGSMAAASGLQISYVPQDTGSLRGFLTDFAKEYGVDESLFKAALRKMDFERVQFEKNIADFSDGQKEKSADSKKSL